MASNSGTLIERGEERMKKNMMMLSALFLVLFIHHARATSSEQQVVAEIARENITIYAQDKGGMYQDIAIDFKGNVYTNPFWVNVTNPAYAPQIDYEDINQDGKKEVILILTKGYGTGVLDQEVHVFHSDENRLEEILVDNPMAIVHKNVKASLTPNKADIAIGKKRYELNVKSLNLPPNTLFNEMYFGNIIQYRVKNQQLLAILHPQLAPGVFMGNLLITYDYRDHMYQAKSIDYQLEDL